MLVRVGGLCVVTGLTMALMLGPTFAVAGMVLMSCGGIMLALAMESALAQDHVEREASRGSTVNPFHSHGERVARTP